MKKRFILLTLITAFAGAASAQEGARPAMEPKRETTTGAAPRPAPTLEAQAPATTSPVTSAAVVATEVPSAHPETSVSPEYLKRAKDYAAAANAPAKVTERAKWPALRVANEHAALAKANSKKLKDANLGYEKKLRELDALELALHAAYDKPLADLATALADNSQVTNSLAELYAEGKEELAVLLKKLHNERQAVHRAHQRTRANLEATQANLDDAKLSIDTAQQDLVEHAHAKAADQQTQAEHALGLEKKRAGLAD